MPGSAPSGSPAGPYAPSQHAPGVPDHVRRFLDGDGADPSGDGLGWSAGPAAPSPRQLTDAILADPESVARLVDAVGDAVERRIVRDLVRQGRTAYPGLV